MTKTRSPEDVESSCPQHLRLTAPKIDVRLGIAQNHHDALDGFWYEKKGIKHYADRIGRISQEFCVPIAYLTQLKHKAAKLEKQCVEHIMKNGKVIIFGWRRDMVKAVLGETNDSE